MTDHPSKWTPAILDAIAPVIAELGMPVHDPFAGTGVRLGKLCDRVGLTFTGTEIEPEFIADPRVQPGDSTEAGTYPAEPYVIVTSPVYPNGMTDHFHARDGSKRHTYRQALATILGYDRPLHIHNMGRYGNRYRRSLGSEASHLDIADRCVRHWPELVVVNVKDVVTVSYVVDVVERWCDLLERHSYEVQECIDVPAPGQRHGANGYLRAETEAVLVASRSTPAAG